MENELLMSLLPTWHSLSAATDIHAPELLFPSVDGQSTGRFFTSFWEMSTESNGGLAFDSAISSLASSPVSPPSTSNDGFLIREMIGKLRSSGEFLPRSYIAGHPYNEGTHKLANPTSPTYPSRLTDLSPAERLPSLGYQSFRGRSGQFAELAALGTMTSRASSSPSLRQLGPHMEDPQRSKNPNPNPALQDRAKLSNSQESSVSNLEKNQGLETDAKAASEANWRKREAAHTRQEAGTDGDMGSKRVKQSDGGNGNENGHSKAEEEATGGGGDHGKYEKLQSKSEVKPPEPPKDYIHVRARRGQATDSHSLAERVRREKISERMKILQNLVPGCNKVTGKALMLDEIINYVQSLQRQVEFLSMKLAAVNTGAEINTNDPMAKDVLQSESTDPHQMLPVDSSSSALCGQKCAAVNLSRGAILQHSMDTLENAHFLPYDALLGDDLQSFVQMGFGQN